MSKRERPGMFRKFRVYKNVPCPCGTRDCGGPSARPGCVGERQGELVTDCFVLRPEKDAAARAAVRAYAIETIDGDLRNDLLAWLAPFSTKEEQELRTNGGALLWCMWHEAEVRWEWARSLCEVRVPIFRRPPGYRREVARYEVEERERFTDAVHALARRLGTGSWSFDEETLAKRAQGGV